MRLPSGWTENSSPCPGRVLVEKCIGGKRRADGLVESGGIILPDLVWHGEAKILGMAERTNFMEIVLVSQDCELFHVEHCRTDTRHGATVWCPDMAEGLDHVEGDYWVIREGLLLPALISDRGEPEPLGNFVIVDLDRPESDGAVQFTEKRLARFLNSGKVIAVGGGCMEVGKGMKVWLDHEKFKVFRSSRGIFGIIQEKSILAIADS